MQTHAHQHCRRDGHFPHAGAALRPFIADDQHAAGLDLLCRHCAAEIIFGVKADRRSAVMKHLGDHAALFHEASAGGEIAVQHRVAAIRIKRIVHRVNDLRIHRPPECVQEFAERAAHGEPAVLIQVSADRLQRCTDAAGLVIIVNVVPAARLEFRDAGDFTLDLVETAEVERDPHHFGDRADMQLGIGRTAGRRHVAKAVHKALFSHDVAEAYAVLRERDDPLAD